MYKCNNCNARFEEHKTKRISLEDLYGVGDLFRNHHYTEIHICPNCENEDADIEELKQCPLCEEWFEEDELIDTEGLVNGSVGYVCEQCFQDNDIE